MSNDLWLEVSFLSGIYDKKAPTKQIKWVDFVETLRAYHKPAAEHNKKTWPAFTPSSRVQGTKLHKRNIDFVYAYVWDIDSKPKADLDLVTAWLSSNGFAHCVYSTGSIGKDGPGLGRWRVVAPLTTPVPSKLWLPFWNALNRASGDMNDQACKDPSRLYFVPGWKPGQFDGERLFTTVDGEAIDPQPWLASASPMELIDVATQPVDKLELLNLAYKLEKKRDPMNQSVGKKLNLVLAGQSYADPGEDQNLDLWRYRLAKTIMAEIPNGDIQAIADCFYQSHKELDDNPEEIERRQKETIDKLARFQAEHHSIPAALLLGEFENEIIEGDSDLELTQWVLARFGKTVFARGKFWIYSPDKGTWAAQSENKIWNQLKNLVGAFITSRKRLFTLDEKTASATYRGTRLDVLDEEFFDHRKAGVCFANGYVDLSKPSCIELQPHKPENRATFGIDIDWDPDATCPNWLAILNRVFETDPDKDQKIMVLQEFIGAALAGVASQYTKALLLVGDGSNGKSTILDIIQSLFPDDAITAQTPHDWSNSSSAYNLVDLMKASVNIAPEVSSKNVTRPELLKSIIAGDPIQARPIREMPFTGRPFAAHFLAMNELFSTNDNSRGFWRRFIILRFNQNFEGRAEKQTSWQIKAQVKEEKAGIYAWAFDGLRRLLTTGKYTYTESAVQELEEWQTDNDPIREWFLECWEVFDADAAGTLKNSLPTGSMLYLDLKTWADNNSIPENKLLRRKKLIENLTKSPYFVPKHKSGGHLCYGVRRKAPFLAG